RNDGDAALVWNGSDGDGAIGVAAAEDDVGIGDDGLIGRVSADDQIAGWRIRVADGEWNGTGRAVDGDGAVRDVGNSRWRTEERKEKLRASSRVGRFARGVIDIAGSADVSDREQLERKLFVVCDSVKNLRRNIEGERNIGAWNPIGESLAAAGLVVPC